MGLGQYNSLREYCGHHTASFVFLILVPAERWKPCDCRYWCIERVCWSLGTLLCCDRGHSSKWLSKKNVGFFLVLTKFKHAYHFPCDGHLFLSKLVTRPSRNTYFLCISMIFFTIYLLFRLKVHFRCKNDLSMGTPYILLIKACDAIRPGLNCLISMIISVEPLCGF